MTNKKYKSYNQEKIVTVSIAEGKKDFSRLMHDAVEEKKEIIVTKRGKPVTAIVPYEKYKHLKRLEGYRKIMAAREAFLNADVSADVVFKESRKQLEKKY